MGARRDILLMRWIFLAFLIAMGFSGSVLAEERLIIIANSNVPVEQLSEAEIKRIFLLKKTTWKNGSQIIPVNREAASSARVRFSGDVLGVSIRSLSNYWNQMQFKGHMPPVVQESNAAMIAFVQNVPGAIGYIHAEVMPDGVKILGEWQ